MSALVPAIIRRFETVAETVAGAHTPLRSAAQDVSARALWAARAELAMQALQAACTALLETDGGGQPLNYDAKTGRILAPMPWGKAGGVVWGLRSSEQRVLRQVLIEREKEPWAIFLYERQAWYVAPNYSARMVEVYLRRQPISIAEYRQAWAVCAPKWTSARNSAQGSARNRAW